MGDPIQITIKKGQTADGVKPDDATSGETSVEKKEQGKPSARTGAVNTAIINAGRQVMMNGISMYGELTGDHMISENLNMALSGTADIFIVAKGGPVGAIAVGTKHAIQIGNSFVQQVNERRRLEVELERSGNLAHQGSRYGR